MILLYLEADKTIWKLTNSGNNSFCDCSEMLLRSYRISVVAFIKELDGIQRLFQIAHKCRKAVSHSLQNHTTSPGRGSTESHTISKTLNILNV